MGFVTEYITPAIVVLCGRNAKSPDKRPQYELPHLRLSVSGNPMNFLRVCICVETNAILAVRSPIIYTSTISTRSFK